MTNEIYYQMCKEFRFNLPWENLSGFSNDKKLIAWYIGYFLRIDPSDAIILGAEWQHIDAITIDDFRCEIYVLKGVFSKNENFPEETFAEIKKTWFPDGSQRETILDSINRQVLWKKLCAIEAALRNNYSLSYTVVSTSRFLAHQISQAKMINEANDGLDERIILAGKNELIKTLETLNNTRCLDLYNRMLDELNTSYRRRSLRRLSYDIKLVVWYLCNFLGIKPHNIINGQKLSKMGVGVAVGFDDEKREIYIGQGVFTKTPDKANEDMHNAETDLSKILQTAYKLNRKLKKVLDSGYIITVLYISTTQVSSDAVDSFKERVKKSAKNIERVSPFNVSTSVLSGPEVSDIWDKKQKQKAQTSSSIAERAGMQWLFRACSSVVLVVGMFLAAWSYLQSALDGSGATLLSLLILFSFNFASVFGFAGASLQRVSQPKKSKPTKGKLLHWSATNGRWLIIAGHIVTILIYVIVTSLSEDVLREPDAEQNIQRWLLWVPLTFFTILNFLWQIIQTWINVKGLISYFRGDSPELGGDNDGDSEKRSTRRPRSQTSTETIESDTDSSTSGGEASSLDDITGIGAQDSPGTNT